jgi:hypothetical protein
LTQLDEICKKKSGNITKQKMKKMYIGISPYLTQLNEICKNNTDWGAIQKKLNVVPSKKMEKNEGAIKKKSKKMTI